MWRSVAKAAYRSALQIAPEPVARRLRYVRTIGLRRPTTFNDHLLAAMILERDPRIPPLVDKISAKDQIARKLGQDWIIPTLFAGDALPRLSERTWPLPYVIKPSHRSGAVALVRSPAERDWTRLEALCSEWTASFFDVDGHEWFYQRIPRRLLVEPMIGDGEPPPDFKFFVFGGRVECVQVDTNRFGGHSRSMYSRDWKLLPYTNRPAYPRIDPPMPRPQHLDEMVEAAELLGSEWRFVRVDLYDLRQGPKFGEMTFYPEAACNDFDPPEYDLVLGRMFTDS